MTGGVLMKKIQSKNVQQQGKQAEKKAGYGDKKLTGENRPAE